MFCTSWVHIIISKRHTFNLIYQTTLICAIKASQLFMKILQYFERVLLEKTKHMIFFHPTTHTKERCYDFFGDIVFSFNIIFMGKEETYSQRQPNCINQCTCGSSLCSYS